ncbi:MAG: aminopeptidase N [Legionellaceae bacterium]|nr:aminopeptidase N [Legionellaceae bacterium]
MSKQTIYLNDYQAPSFQLETVDLTVDLYDEYALVINKMRLVRMHPGPLCLYGEELKLESIALDGHELKHDAYVLEGENLIFETCPDAFILTITTRIYPKENTALSGLYHAEDIFCTQCEAEGFRRITYFPDRPDVLAVYTTRISANQADYPVLLSNGNLIDSGVSGERHWAVWHDPFKKPSYLFALVAGKLACVSDQFVTMSGRKIDLHVYVEAGVQDRCAHALASLKAAMAWDEREYGREYDLDVYMIVAINAFNMGAMENKGLNVFNAKYVLARPDTATDQDYAGIESVIAHEYFHNWTGNRVTCRDWFQLSLKEGLTVFRDQEFSRDMNSRDVNRIQDVKVLRQAQFPEDAGRMAHPVRPPAYQEINNFYTATIYNKGAEVIRMLQTLLSPAGFRRGTDLYFERHDGEAVTIEDFVAAMADANNQDLTQFFRWYTQAGTPEVKLTERSYQDGCLSLSFTQTCPKTPDNPDDYVKQPFPIPIRIALFNQAGERMPVAQDVLLLEKFEQQFILDGLSQEPAHISLLRDFSAPVNLSYEASNQDLLGLLRVETDGFAKWDAAQRVVRAALFDAYNTQNISNWCLQDDVITAFRHVLQDEVLDHALRAELLMPPSFEEVVSGIAHIDVTRWEEARDAFRKRLGEALWSEISSMYATLEQAEDHAMHAEAFGRRRLKHVCLWLMMHAKPEDALGLCKDQFEQAKTMTDQVGSLGLLINSPDEAAQNQAITGFYKQWKHDELVLDKWFALQASAEHEGALARVKKLLEHPDFDLKKPNKVRAVIGAFCQNNPRHFHAVDGSGYAFLTEQLLKVDKLNPQISARLATPFTRWQRFDMARQKHMLEQLKYLSEANLSADLREIVTKSLAQ